ncbi:ornithine cyclodeaminase [Pelagibacterium lacus]|uniref:Ornithine cyclodeaminase n=1 Tax=Pelagibacterium lacus TaxID=2282655 RepID=A0A369W2I1_9HYPH|nr:ornithine cyclodeaminase [Pelagibacterium lacus]RDE08886.1 ornithine cyclodeaminase [Pelagibacterium lacus]
MQSFDAAAIDALLDYPGLIAALEEAHRGGVPEAQHMVQDEPEGGENKFVALVGWARAEIVAVKMVGVFPGNLKRQPPEASVQGLVAVFDADTGAPRFVADGAEMTFRKTAADSGMGSKLLARQDASTLLVVGAGGLAPHMIAAHTAARPGIERVMVWNRTRERAEALVDRLAGERAVEVVENLDDAVAVADIVSCVTMSDRPLVKGECLKPGAHLDLVGAYLPTMREADDAAMARGRIFVDTRNGMEGAGDLCQPVAAGVIGWNAVIADAFALCQGQHAGRGSDDEITIYKNVGGGHLDLFTARHLAARVRSATI